MLSEIRSSVLLSKDLAEIQLSHQKFVLLRASQMILVVRIHQN